MVGDKFKVDLPKSGGDDDDESGWTDEARAKVDVALKSGAEAQKNLAMLIPQYLKHQAEALAYKVAVKAEALDEVDDIQAKLNDIKTPEAMNTLAKEIELEYREAKVKDGSTKKGEDKGSEGSSDSKRKFDEGGGSGNASSESAVQQKIDNINVNALTSTEDLAKAQEALDDAYEEATKS